MVSSLLALAAVTSLGERSRKRKGGRERHTQREREREREREGDREREREREREIYLVPGTCSHTRPMRVPCVCDRCESWLSCVCAHPKP